MQLLWCSVRLIFITFSVVLLLGLSGCRHKPDFAEKPLVSFSSTVLPIIQNNCDKSGCHDGQEQFVLQNYEDIRSKVKPQDAAANELYKSMTYLEIAGVMPTPPDQPLREE